MNKIQYFIFVNYYNNRFNLLLRILFIWQRHLFSSYFNLQHLSAKTILFLCHTFYPTTVTSNKVNIFSRFMRNKSIDCCFFFLSRRIDDQRIFSIKPFHMKVFSFIFCMKYVHINEKFKYLIRILEYILVFPSEDKVHQIHWEKI